MTERGEVERRNDRLRDLEVISGRQAEWLTEQITINPSEAALFRDGLNVEVVEDKDLFCIFPARIISNASESRHTFAYHKPTIDELVSRFSLPYQLTEGELSELYIGTGIAAKLLKNAIQDTNLKQMQRMTNILLDPDAIFKEIRANDTLSDNHRTNIIQSIMQSDDNRIGNINVLRFAFGMVYRRAGEVEDLGSNLRQTRVMLQFRQGLVETLLHRPDYIKLGKFFQKITDDFDRKFDIEGEFIGEKVFADATGEFELAACFPMSAKELQKILKIVR